MVKSWRDSYGPGGGAQLAMPSLTPVVRRVLIANVAIWLLLYFSEFPRPELRSTVHDVFGLSPFLWKEWFPFVPLWQPLTYGFLHASLGHILFNMLGLYFFGTMLEEIIGSRAFAALYLTAIVIGGVVSLLLGLLSGALATTIGASGGVMAVVVAAAVLRPETRVIFIVFPLSLKVMAMIFVGMDVFTALESFKGHASNVSWSAHLSGAAWGFLAARKGLIWRDPLRGLERWRDARAQEQRGEEEARLDQLLAKINREGIQALSQKEKAFLKRTSKRR